MSRSVCFGRGRLVNINCFALVDRDHVCRSRLPHHLSASSELYAASNMSDPGNAHLSYTLISISASPLEQPNQLLGLHPHPLSFSLSLASRIDNIVKLT